MIDWGGKGDWSIKSYRFRGYLFRFLHYFVAGRIRPLICKVLGHKVASYSDLDEFTWEYICARCYRPIEPGT